MQALRIIVPDYPKRAQMMCEEAFQRLYMTGKYYGDDDDFDDLYNADFRNPILKIIIICSLIGTVLSIIPFLFYDLTEDKRSNMVRAFKIRALFSDFEENKAENEKLIDAVTEIYTVFGLYENETDEKKKAAYKIAVDEFELYKNSKPDLWLLIEEKYNCLVAKA